MSMKTDIMAAYFDTIQGRSEEAASVEVGALVENIDGKRFTVEKISKDYEEVKKYDKLGEGEAWLRHNENITEAQTWVAVKDEKGKCTVARYGDDGVRVIEEKSFDSKPEHVRVDKDIMDAYSSVINESKELYKELKDAGLGPFGSNPDKSIAIGRFEVGGEYPEIVDGKLRLYILGDDKKAKTESYSFKNVDDIKRILLKRIKERGEEKIVGPEVIKILSTYSEIIGEADYDFNATEDRLNKQAAAARCKCKPGTTAVKDGVCQKCKLRVKTEQK